jgi:predicted phosphodiesterase
MPRNHVWHFHNPRLSVAQSGMRAAISHSQIGSGGAALMLSRVADWAKGLFDIHRTTVPAVGVCAGEPVMKAFGTVLKQIDSGAIKDTDAACAAFVATRAAQSQGTSAQPAATAPQAAPAAQPASLGAGSVSAGLRKDCMDLVAQYLLAWVFDDQPRENQIESEFKLSSCDPGWLVALNAWLLFYWDGKPPVYYPPSEGTVPIPLPPAGAADGLLRVGILGDWGTGEPEAIAVLDQLMQLEPDLIIHLGDIYYAGTFDECRTNFLIPIQAARAKYGNNLPVYNIPGNHDYYSGGKGFFAILPLLNQGVPNASVQENSFLCLQNDQWQLQCMDTGYNDHDLKDVAADITHLEPAETEWHQSQLLAAGSRKIILISHHQLFSAFATIGAGYQNPFLTKNLADWRAAGVSNITVWLWGHEHLLEIYAPPASDGSGLPVLGRCVGHGAFPIFDNSGDYNKQPQSPIPLQTADGFPNGYIQTGVDGQVYASGFAMLTLGAEDGKADYYQVDFTGDINAARRRLLWSDGLS